MIERRLRERFVDVRMLETFAPGSARGQARALAEEGCAIVTAAGGDGTVRDVMEGVLGTDAALAVLPFGTGNDFARSIGLGVDVDAAIEALAAGHRKRIDVARWSRGDDQGHFLNVAGCGFDAVVADRVNRGFKRLRGKWAYIAGVVRTLATYRATCVTIRADGDLIDTRAMLCAFANAKSYGGGMLVAPTADLGDGLLDLILVRELSRTEFLRTFPRVFKGTHLSHPKVIHRTFRVLTIESDPPVPYLLDGELLGPGPLRIEVVPSALEVIVPAGHNG